ncbi:hypothetical protein Patl1_24443 [Pistacia atlantica]|uniref:Uncharacterized protein n=1 Tax=Pistacia atlantica TaxID=434234 RepID=A0ACC0ZYB6_9ROSI|nr:hypothetical protein Patl1_24443 [Pistacia atlantica]
MLDSRATDKNWAPSEPINSKPLIVNALGPVGNVSGAIALTLEWPDRIPPAVSINSHGPMNSSRLVDVKPRIADDGDKVKRKFLIKIQVARLIYTNSGLALFALIAGAIHNLWKWQLCERNPSVKATAYVASQLWQPPSGTLMTNDINDGKPAEESAACIALSKNDSYVMSALVMTMFMPPPSAATYLAFHPQDNYIIAIGMEDSTIQIYNVRVDEVKIKLKGHQNRITGLAFSHTLNALVSSGADAQLCTRSIDKWEKLKSRFILAPADPSIPFGRKNSKSSFIMIKHICWWFMIAKFPFMTASLNVRIQCFKAFFVYSLYQIVEAHKIHHSLTMYILQQQHYHIAAHPSEPNQIGLGMSDGAVHVVEPSDAELKWVAHSPKTTAPPF